MSNQSSKKQDLETFDFDESFPKNDNESILQEFEKELAGGEYEDFLAEFEKELDAIENMDSETLETEMPTEILYAQPSSELEEEPNLAGVSDENIEEILNGNEDIQSIEGLEGLEGIEEIVELGDGVEPIENLDAFEIFAENEMPQAISDDVILDDLLPDMGAPEEEKDKKKKKPGLLDKIKGIFSKFGKKEAPDKAAIAAANGVDIESLSDENMEILMSFEDADKAQKGKKGKKEKPKKEKKKKEKKKKEKKPKEPKPKKEKKPKPPKEIDTTPPLPKKPVILIWVLAISVVVLILVGTELSSYKQVVTEAEKLFDQGEYAEAYEMLQGVEVKDEELQLYNHLAILAAADGELNAYEVFLYNNKMEFALDSLVCAAGRCDLNAGDAMELGCDGYLNTIQKKVTNELSEQFGMTYEDALDIYYSVDREDYTILLYEKLEQLGLK